MADLFWLSDEQWAVIERFMPKDQPGPERKDDREIISGILHVLTPGCRWRDCPAAYGPRTTVYNRFNRWSRRGFWKAMLAAHQDSPLLIGLVAQELGMLAIAEREYTALTKAYPDSSTAALLLNNVSELRNR